MSNISPQIYGQHAEIVTAEEYFFSLSWLPEHHRLLTPFVSDSTHIQHGLRLHWSKFPKKDIERK